MKQNGFTLVEMIAAIVLIALLGTIILVNMTGIKGSEDQKSANKFITSVEEAACTYIDMGINAEYRDKCKVASTGCDVYLRVLTGGDPEYSPNSGSFTSEEKEARRFALIDPTYKDPETNLTAEEEKNDVYVHIQWVSDGSQYVKKVCEFKRK